MVLHLGLRTLVVLQMHRSLDGAVAPSGGHMRLHLCKEKQISFDSDMNLLCDKIRRRKKRRIKKSVWPLK